MNIKPIPLPAKYFYKISSEGELYNGDKKIKGWKHLEKRSGKYYLRVSLVMKGGKRKLFYMQRLVYLAFMPHIKIDEYIIRHKSVNSLDNSVCNLEHGTYYDNNVIDRKRDGNYYKRGGKSILKIKNMKNKKN